MQKGLAGRFLTGGLALLAAVSFFIGWNVTLPQSFSLPLFNGPINAPLVDFVGLIILSFFGAAVLMRRYVFIREVWLSLRTGLLLLTLFVLSAVFSSLLVYHHDIAVSLQYTLRSIIFTLFAFFLLPVAVVQDKETFYRILRVWLVIGVFVAIYGLSSLLIVGSVDGAFVRAIPYVVGSFAPLGTNQNALAQMLTTLIPFLIILLVKAHTKSAPPSASIFIGCVLVTMVLVTLLTLSRAAWLVLAFQIGMLVYWYKDVFHISSPSLKVWKNYYRLVVDWVVAGVAISLVAYMVLFLSSSYDVVSSNSSRVMMLGVVKERFVSSPIFGEGPGTFYRIVGETERFIRQFGAPLDAHGVLQKILLEQGIVGLITFIVFMAWFFKFLFETQASAKGDQQFVARMLFVAAASAVGFQLFSTSYYMAVMWLPLGLCLAGALLIRRRAL